ncbi:MAG: exo-beta-N-acetylmuramidase NamZ domain-containing protein [Vicinamibacterales bacterium]
MSVTLGSTRLLASGRLKGQRIGIAANPASIDHAFRHIVDLLAAEPDVELGAVFGPQHGFRADVQDNMVETPHATLGGVPLYSLYSDTREPTAEMLAGLDALVIDLQDIGARIYTYIYTMANCLRACRRHGLKVIVCDRPNPIGGVAVEGPTLEAGHESFVGQFPIPMRHGLTIGELALLFNRHFGIDADLDVITLHGWSRAMFADDTGLPWVMPSPNIPTLESAVVYPGTVLFEGTMASEGRGTTRPFELIGAPWVQPDRMAAALNALALPGVHFRPVVFEPTFQKHARTACGGCQIHVTDRTAFQPVLVGTAVLAAVRAEDPARFAWREPPYEYETRKAPIDILAGTPAFRAAVDAGRPAREIADTWHAGETAFAALRQPFLLYE